MTNLMQAEDVIRQAQPGSMLYAAGEVFGGAGDGEQYTALLVREDTEHLRVLGKNPEVEIRAGAFVEVEAIAVAVLMKIRNELYESWWNYHQPEGGQLYFDQMMHQPIIPIMFFSASRRVRLIAVKNGVAPFFEQTTGLIVARSAWAMQAFDLARAQVEKRFPSVQALWIGLGSQTRMNERGEDR